MAHPPTSRLSQTRLLAIKKWHFLICSRQVSATTDCQSSSDSSDSSCSLAKSTNFSLPLDCVKTLSGRLECACQYLEATDAHFHDAVPESISMFLSVFRDVLSPSAPDTWLLHTELGSSFISAAGLVAIGVPRDALGKSALRGSGSVLHVHDANHFTNSLATTELGLSQKAPHLFLGVSMRAAAMLLTTALIFLRASIPRVHESMAGAGISCSWHLAMA